MTTTARYTLGPHRSQTAQREWRAGLCVAVALGLSPFLFGSGEQGAGKNEFYRGKVVPLASVLEKHGVKLDADAEPAWMALVSDDGKLYPLVKDAGSRMFYLDPQLLNRPMRLTGRVLPGTQLLQVLVVHSEIKGEPHEVYYWCDICSIRRYEKRICECCGGPMELREVPVKD
jgi:hypothetical protein